MTTPTAEKAVSQPKPMGRPKLPPGEGATARLEWRTTPALKAEAEAKAAAAGLSVSQWLNRRVVEG